MRSGLIYPQTEFGSDPIAIRDYAQTAEELGYTHITAYDHILGANPDRPDKLSGPYTYQTPFHEPFVLFSFMSGITKEIEFATGIIILPQRQTAVVAKQAATLDLLCGGRFRLGVAIGWNHVEYTALGQNFHTRGQRIEEQVILLRQLWTQPLVRFEGRWHTIPDAGLNPLPYQRPIPIWFGGQSEPVLKRIARLGDGWMVNYRSSVNARPTFDKLHQYLIEAGRENVQFGIEVRILYGEGDPGTWEALIHDWQELGVSHISLNTMGSGFDTPAKHLNAIRTFAKAMQLPR